MKTIRNQWVVAALSVSMLWILACGTANARKSESYGGAWALSVSSQDQSPAGTKRPADSAKSNQGLRIRTNLNQVGSDIRHMTTKENIPRIRRRTDAGMARSKKQAENRDAVLVDNR